MAKETVKCCRNTCRQESPRHLMVRIEHEWGGNWYCPPHVPQREGKRGTYGETKPDWLTLGHGPKPL